MAFMEPEVLDKQEWAEVETNYGTSWVPLDVLSASEAASARRGDFEPLLKYTEGTKAYNDQSRIRKGYGVRLSAPGYLDATNWEFYSSKKEALKRARELASEAEGEDYATKKKPAPRHHATKKAAPRIQYWVRTRGGPRSSWDIVPVYVLGTTTRADEGLVGHDLRVRPLRLGKGPYTMVVAPDDVEDKP